jgi:hypothetical protein
VSPARRKITATWRPEKDRTRKKTRGAWLIVTGLIALALASCASERNYRPVSPGEGPGMPRYVELNEEHSIATVHFPRGLYTLEAEDDAGYYYRSPRPLTKHAFAGLQPYDGGIYVRKTKRAVLRGYVVWAGGRTKIGNLTRAGIKFRDQ